jgi:hypothetical protein
MLNLQDIAAFIAVTACAGHLLYRGWKSLTQKECSSGCGGCGSAKRPAAAGTHVHPSLRTTFVPATVLYKKK